MREPRRNPASKKISSFMISDKISHHYNDDVIYDIIYDLRLMCSKIGMQQTKAQRRLVLGFGADRSEAGRGGQAHHKHRMAGTVDSEQLRATGTGSRSGKARAFGEKRKQNGAM